MRAITQYQVNGITVSCLTDGGFTFPEKVFPDVATGLRDARLHAAGLNGIDTSFNCYVLQYPDGSISMVDTGCGSKFGENGGAMLGLLGQLGINPVDVGRIIFTHLHSDHCGGALDGDVLRFPDAQVVLHSKEAAFWRSQDVAGAQVLALCKTVKTVTDGDDLGDGLRVWALPGHTPGHMGLRLGELALVGDVVHSEALQFADPQLCPIYDSDPDQARQSRRHALENVADDGLVWSGCHMLGPDKFALLQRAGNGFHRVPL